VCSHKKDLSKKNVFSCLLNTVSEDASVTLAGRVFNTRVAVTKCVRSRSSRVRGTSSRWRDPKRSRCSTSASSLQRRSRAGYGDAMFWRRRETKSLFVTHCADVVNKSVRAFHDIDHRHTRIVQLRNYVARTSFRNSKGGCPRPGAF